MSESPPGGAQPPLPASGMLPSGEEPAHFWVQTDITNIQCLHNVCEAPQPSLWSNLVLQPFIFQRFFQVLPFPSAVFITMLRFGAAPGLMETQLLVLSGATKAPSYLDAIGIRNHTKLLQPSEDWDPH